MSSEALQVGDSELSYIARSKMQEVPPGYKRTEVGVIPEEWSIVPLSMVCAMKSGESITAAQIDSFSRYPCYGGNGLRGFTNRFTHSGRFALIGRQGALCGNVMGVSGEFFASEHAVVVTPLQQTEIAWLTYVLGAMHLNQYSESSAQPGLSVVKLLTLKIGYPPSWVEQRAIAEALSDVDALLRTLEALIAKKRAIKQAAMQQLLTGRTRLPGFSGERMRTTEIGEIPNGWSLGPLATLVDPQRGIRYGIVQPGTYDPDGRYMIRGQDYSEAKGWADPKDVFRVSPGVEEKYRNARVQEGDLIMTIVGYCGHVEMVPAWLDGSNLTQTTARIAIKSEQAIPMFCKYLLQSHVGKVQVSTYLKGAAQPGLNCEDVEKFLICLPPIEEQSAIVTVLSDIDAEIAALENRRDKTWDIKQGMMQQLLTGRVRLVEPGLDEAAA